MSVKWAFGHEYEKVDFNYHIPISKQCQLFTYNEIREFNQSAYKRTYTSEKHDLASNGYVEWMTNRIKEIGRLVGT